GLDKSVKLCSTATGEIVQTLRGHTAPVTAVAFAPGGKGLATGSADGILRLLDMGGKLLRKSDAHKDGVLCLAYVPGGELLASGGCRGASCWPCPGREGRCGD